MSSRRRVWGALFLVVAVASAACSSADDGDGEAATASAGDAVEEAPAGDQPGPDAEDEGVGADVPDMSDLPPGSTRGISDDTIKIGVLELNLEFIGGTTGADIALAETRVGDAYKVFADDINAAGGINGRDLEVSVFPFNPIDPASEQTACIQATQDNESFVVIAMGGLGPTTVLCLAELNDTLTLASGQTAEVDLERLDGKLFTIGMNETRQYRGLVEAMHDLGEFDGKTLGVIHESTPEIVAAIDDGALPMLEELGYPAPPVVEVPCEGRICSQYDTAVQVFKEAGVDALIDGLSSLSNPPFIDEAIEFDFRPDYYVTPFNVAATLTEILAKDNAERREAYAGALSVSGDPNMDHMHPEFPAIREPQPGEANYDCNERLSEVTGAGFPFDPTGAAETNDSRALVAGACTQLSLVVHALEAAGPDLDDVKVSFQLQQIKDFEDVWPWDPVTTQLTEEIDQGWDDGKFDAGNRLTVVEFNPDTLEWHPITNEYVWPE